MKKTLIVLALLVVVVLVLGTPALIGSLIHGQAAGSLEERLPEADIRWDRGWFRTALNIADEDLRADFDFSHVSLTPPGWLTVDGRVVLGALGATVEVSGHVGPALDADLRASAPALTVPGIVTWRYREPALEAVAADNRIDVHGSAETLEIADGLGNQLMLAETELNAGLGESGASEIELRIEVSAARSGLPRSRAALVFDHVDPLALEQLVRSLQQLSSSEQGTTSGGLAAIGLASAWQQLAARGLVLRLESLMLDGELEVKGRWIPGQRRLELDGGGARDTLLAWWSRIDGLLRQVPPREARAAAELALTELERSGE